MSNSYELPVLSIGAGWQQSPSEFGLATRKLTQPLCEPGFRARSFRGEVFAITYALADESYQLRSGITTEQSSAHTNLPLTYQRGDEAVFATATCLWAWQLGVESD